MKTEITKAKVAKEKKSAFKPAFQPRMAQDGTYKPGETLRATIDEAISAAVRKHFGKVVPVIGQLGSRYHAPYKQGQPYLRLLLDNGHTVFVSLASGVITVSDKPASKSSFTVREFNKRQASRTARDTAKLAREEKVTRSPSNGYQA